MGQYASDATAREEYNRLWDAAVDYKRPAPTASEVSLLFLAETPRKPFDPDHASQPYITGNRPIKSGFGFEAFISPGCLGISFPYPHPCVRKRCAVVL
jgi:hypothetical protein